MNSKYVVAAAAALFSLQLALPALAEDRPTLREDRREVPTEDRSLRAGEAFCDRLAATRSQFEQRVSGRKNALDTRREEHADDRTDRREKGLERKEERKEGWEDKKDQALVRLEQDLKTDAQRAALAAFKAAMNAALDARKTAVDAANKEFRAGIDSQIAGRKSAVDAAVMAFRRAIAAAFDKAKSGCASGTSAETVRTNLRNDLAAAQRAFDEARKAVEKMGPQAKTLADQRNAKVRAAFETFRAAAEAARKELKAALG